MIRRPRLTIAIAVLGGFCSATGLLQSDVRPLTLYQKAGRASWVILGEISDGDDRFAAVKVIEVMKGTYTRPDLRVVYRLGNFLRKSWEGKLEFALGERSVLFLKRYEKEPGDPEPPKELREEDVFAPVFGSQGKFTLPEEGSPAYLEAIREFVRVTGLADAAAQEEALLAFLDSVNPHILQAGLEQVVDRRLAGEAQVGRLLRLAESPSDAVRLNAVQILGQVVEDLRAAKKTLPDQPDVVNRLKGMVMGDGGDVFRAEAVKVVAALAGESESPFLERVSKEDRSQIVRYEAGRALLGLRGKI